MLLFRKVKVKCLGMLVYEYVTLIKVEVFSLQTGECKTFGNVIGLLKTKMNE